MKQILFSTFLFFYSLHAISQDCEKYKSDLENVQKELQLQIVNIEEQTKELEKFTPDTTDHSGGNHHVDFEIISWKEQKIVFDLVKVTMKDHPMSFDIPEIKMDRRSFDVPTTTCKWEIGWVLGVRTKTWKCTSKMKKNYFDVPEMKMKTIKISTKIPEFKLDRKEISFKVPEIKMKSPVPNEGVNNEEQKKAEYIETQAKLIEGQSQMLEDESKKKVKSAASLYLSCSIEQVGQYIMQLDEDFVKNTSELRKTIENVASAGIDPTNLTNSDGKVINLLSEFDKRHQEYASARSELENALTQLETELINVFKELDTENSTDVITP